MIEVPNTDVQITGVPSSKIPEVYPHVKHLIEQTYDQWTDEEVFEGLKKAHLQLWIGVHQRDIKLVMVTQVKRETDTRNRCMILFLGGREMNRFFPAMDYIATWARANQCYCLQTYTRKGIYKYLKRYFGFKLVCKFNGYWFCHREL